MLPRQFQLRSCSHLLLLPHCLRLRTHRTFQRHFQDIEPKVQVLGNLLVRVIISGYDWSPLCILFNTQTWLNIEGTFPPDRPFHVINAKFGTEWTGQLSTDEGDFEARCAQRWVRKSSWSVSELDLSASSASCPPSRCGHTGTIPLPAKDACLASILQDVESTSPQ
jgi:hypothetical protein